MAGIAGYIDWEAKASPTARRAILEHGHWAGHFEVEEREGPGWYLALFKKSEFPERNQFARDFSSGKSVAIAGELFPALVDESATNGAHPNPSQHILGLWNGDVAEIPEGIEGHFAACLINEKEHEACLLADHSGLRYLLYMELDGVLYFASDIITLIAIGGSRCKPLPHRMAHMVKYGHMLGRWTYFEHIQYLSGGEQLIWRKGKTSVRKYYNYPVPSNDNALSNYDLACEDLGHHLSQVTLPFVNSAENSWATLTGGLDSRCICGSLVDQQVDFRTITMGDNRSMDVSLAERIARKIGTEHFTSEIDENYLCDFATQGTRYTDGMSSYFHVRGDTIIKKVRQHGGHVVFSGLGADVLLGSALHTTVTNVKEALRFLHTCPSENTLSSLFNADLISDVDEAAEAEIERQLKHCSTNDWTVRMNHLNLANRQCRWIFPGSRSWTGHVWNRHPFYSRRFIDYCFRMPTPWLKSQRIYQSAILKQWPKTLAKIPWEKTRLPVGAPDWMYFLKRVVWRLNRDFLKINRSHTINSYAKTLSTNSRVKEFVYTTLSGNNCQVLAFTSESGVSSLIQSAMNGNHKDVEALGRLLTIEQMLRLAKDHI